MGRAGFAFSLSIKGLEVSAGGTWRTVLHPCNSRPANQGAKPAGDAPGLFQRRDSFPRRRRETLCAKGRTVLAVYRRRDRAGPSAVLEQSLHCGESLAPALGPVAGDGAVGLPMPLQPGLAFAVEGLALRQFRLAALAVGAPGHAFRREQQVQVVAPPQQGGFEPVRTVAEENPAPEDVAQQVGIEDQQRGRSARAASSQASCPRAMAGMSA